MAKTSENRVIYRFYCEKNRQRRDVTYDVIDELQRLSLSKCFPVLCHNKVYVHIVLISSIRHISQILSISSVTSGECHAWFHLYGALSSCEESKTNGNYKMKINIGSEMNFHFIRYLWNELCVLYPEPLARGYKTHNEFHKYCMKWKFISDSFYHMIIPKNINI